MSGSTIELVQTAFQVSAGLKVQIDYVSEPIYTSLCQREYSQHCICCLHTHTPPSFTGHMLWALHCVSFAFSTPLWESVQLTDLVGR